MKGGNIKLCRKIEEWEWYKDGNTTRVFIHLLLNANWTEGRYQGVTIPRGSLISSDQKIATILGLKRQQVRTAIKHLKSTNEITTKATNRFTVFTIVNYGKYQDKSNTANQQNNHQANHQLTINQPTTNQQLTTIEEYNNNKNNKNNIYIENINILLLDKITEAWNELSEFGIAKIIKLSKSSQRYKSLKSRLDEYGEENVIKAIKNVKLSSWLKGEKSSWKISFDWFVKPNNFIKVLEGSYTDSSYKQKQNTEDDFLEIARNGI